VRLGAQTDLCISNAIVKTGAGFGVGVVLSVLLFKRE
jgi:inner membrane organizing system protein 1